MSQTLSHQLRHTQTRDWSSDTQMDPNHQLSGRFKIILVISKT